MARSLSIVAVSALLVLPGAAISQIAVPANIDDLVRALLQRRGDATRSQRMALRDETTGRRVSFELGAGARDEWVALFALERSSDTLFVHTVRLVDDHERSLRLRVFDLRPYGAVDGGELIAAEVPPSEVEWLAGAGGLQVTLEGWDESFHASLDDKDLRKIRTFRDRREKAQLPP